MRNTILLLTAAALLGACNTETTEKQVSLESFNDSASYAIGASIGTNVKANLVSEGVDSTHNRLVIAGLTDAINGTDSKLTEEKTRELLDQYFKQLTEERSAKNKAIGEDFLKENATKAGVVTTASGLQYIVLSEGEGPNPTLADQVKVHYTGKLLNGKVFDSSIERNQPIDLYVRSVIPGWTEALLLMKPGAEYKLFIPSELAYGAGGPQGSPIGPNEVLLFDIKLIDIISE